jgi:hypothetical protein
MNVNNINENFLNGVISLGRSKKSLDTSKLKQQGKIPLKKTQLNSLWTLYSHPYNNKDWSPSSYTKILTFDTMEDFYGMLNNIHLYGSVNSWYYYWLIFSYL